IRTVGISCELVTYRDGHAAFAAVRRGEAAAAVVGKFFGVRNNGQYGLKGGRRIGDRIDRVFLFKKGANRDLFETFEQHAEAMKAYENSVFVRSVNRHLGFADTKPPWLMPLIRALAVVVVVLLAATLTLRVQVRRRTAEITARNADLTAEIAERRRTEEALRASELRYRALFETSPLGIVLLAVDGTMLDANDAAAAMIESTRDEMVGRDFRELPAMQDEIALLEERFERTASGGGDDAFEVELTVGDGRRASFEFFLSLIGDGTEPGGVQVIARDTTARRAMEEQILRMQKMDAIGTLAGGIAHDFNNMLTGILGYAEMLRELRGDDEEVVQATDVIEGAARRASHLTSQLLGFARLGKYRDDCVDTRELIGSALEIIEHAIDKRITVERRLDAEPRYISGDEGQLGQVIVNLALNSRDAMPEGGHIVVSTDVVDVPAQSTMHDPKLLPGRYLLIAVSDDGEGMTPEVRERIFEPFFTTRGSQGKTGMGLAMVYGIVKHHDGGIAVDTAPGRGTTVRLYFPVRDEGEPGPVAERGRDKSIVKGKGRILIVDDEAVILQVAVRMVEHLGYDAIVAEGGEEAIDTLRARAGEIDLVLLDLVMPRVDGEAVIDAIREMGSPPPVLLSSGYGLDERVQALLDGGVAGFVQKPYVLSDLSHAVADAIGGRPS
ncbi:MAG TPA: response regulator, partial [Alphaproteobacteria bacterium]|nr:response regulator [Alphaproteobacteria bacterium]